MLTDVLGNAATAFFSAGVDSAIHFLKTAIPISSYPK
jgi:hypothetical protein